MFTVRCPRCRHDQLYDPKLTTKNPTVSKKSKRCVYCGMNFSIHPDQIRTRIVQVGKRQEMNAPLF